VVANPVVSAPWVLEDRGMRIIVRRIRPDDWQVLREVRLGALAESPSAFGSTYEGEAAFDDDAWQLRAIAGSSGARRATWLAADGDHALGLVGAHRAEPDSTDVELVSMWTVPEVRGRGVGRRLVATVLDWAGGTGAGSVSLWVTRGNDPALRLYQAMGFSETGDHQPLPSDPCKDELRMTRPVWPPRDQASS
jgi:GNAT superfamily N-acetyltransferase